MFFFFTSILQKDLAKAKDAGIETDKDGNRAFLKRVLKPE
jgi:hypothetical protein